MEGCIAVECEVDKVLAKFNDIRQKNSDVLQQLIDSLETIRDNLPANNTNDGKVLIYENFIELWPTYVYARAHVSCICDTRNTCTSICASDNIKLSCIMYTFTTKLCQFKTGAVGFSLKYHFHKPNKVKCFYFCNNNYY